MEELVHPPASLNQMPFARHVGFEFHPSASGTSDVSLRILSQHLNTQGVGHGGLVQILIDAAGTTAVLSRVPDAAVLTADLRANFIGKLGPGDRAVARGTVTHLGKSTGYASVVVTNQAGETIALGQVTCVIRAKRA